jgi:outer membrane protein
MEKTGHFRILTFMIAWVLFAVSVPAQEIMTLSEAVARALEKNPDLAIDAPGQEAAQLEFRATKAGYLPRIDFEQSYLAGNNPVFAFGTLLTQQRFTAADFALPSLNAPASLDNLQTRITMQQTIWDFGRTGDRRKQAQLGVASADQTHEDNVRRTLLAVFEGYYATSLAREMLETARLALRSAEALESQAKTRVESGLVVEADLLRSRVYLSTAWQQEIQAQGQLKNAQAYLNRLMGNSLDSPVGETVRLAPKPISIPAEEALVTEMKQRRPDYRNLLTELKQAEIAVGTRRKEFLPALTGYGTWEADNPSFNDYGGSNWAAGITLRWNLLAGGSDKAQMEAARKRLEQKRRQSSAMESAIALELRSALIQYRAAEEQVAVAQAAEAQAEEGLRILRNRYDAGLATMTDILSAETARSSVRTSLAQAVYRQRLSYAQIEYAAGILSPTSPAMKLE